MISQAWADAGVAAAVTVALQHSFLMRWIPSLPVVLQELFTCPVCLGFYIGIATNTMLTGFSVYAVLGGFITGVLALFATRVLDALRAWTEYIQIKTSREL